MTSASQGEGVSQAPNTGGRFFGIPLGEMGWFASLLMGAAAGFIAFFGTTFLGIIGIMVYNSRTHSSVDYALSYQRGGLIVGVATLLTAWAVLGTFWVKRMTRR
jgi:hypothetical protein